MAEVATEDINQRLQTSRRWMRGLRADSAAPPRPPQKSSFNQSALLGSHSDTLGSLQLAGVGWGGGSDTIITLKKYVSHRNLLVEKREQKEKKKKTTH